MDVPDLDAWVAEEKRLVTAHLSAVSSSALTRLDGSFRAAGLADLLAPSRRFSAEDSLPAPTSKPDPAVYLHACRELGIEPAHGLAVEDSVPGATSAVRAGCPTVGIVAFVPEAERGDRRRQLEEAGVLVVVESWPELGDLLFAASAAPGPG
jgi:beta-phosphoglucomutase-like phosphatase (HAD superfamily)